MRTALPRGSWLRLWRTALPLLAVLAAGACRDDLTTALPAAGSAARSAGANPDTIRAREDHGRPTELPSARLARQVPGFGGYAFNRAGNIVVFLKDPGDQRAIGMVRSALSPLFAEWNEGVAVRRGPQRFVFRQAAHSFAELQTWRDRVSLPMLRVPGVDFVDLDEAVNRVVIGIDSRRVAGARAAVRSRLAIWGVPESGVYIAEQSDQTMACLPEDLTCNEPCDLDPTRPDCMDPCAADPYAPECGGGEPADPCDIDPNSPDCSAETAPANPCTADPTLPECDEPSYNMIQYPGGSGQPAPTLLSRRRPIRAGMGIRTQGRFAQDTTVYCGVGFVADFEGQRTFASASHCSPRIAVVDGNNWYQGSLNVSSDLVGYEYKDPPFSVNDFARVNIDSAGYNYNCRASTSSTENGYLCRRSDASLSRLHVAASSFERGYIARTVRRVTEPGFAGPREINLSYPRIRIVGEVGRPQMYARLDKIGPTTGWTSGRVKRICVDRAHSDADPYYTLNPAYIAFRCQIDVDGVSSGGDSGSPVFSWNSTTQTAKLHGILRSRAVGGGFSYTSMDLIRLDLGVPIGDQTLRTY